LNKPTSAEAGTGVHAPVDRLRVISDEALELLEQPAICGHGRSGLASADGFDGCYFVADDHPYAYYRERRATVRRIPKTMKFVKRCTSGNEERQT
jgi:hypothetical protein